MITDIGRILIIVGVVFLGLGLLLSLAGKFHSLGGCPATFTSNGKASSFTFLWLHRS